MSEKKINVSIRLKHQSQAMNFVALNSYEKGQFYCIYLENGTVKKYPIMDIFDVTETY